jgi:hypothetical protein
MPISADSQNFGTENDGTRAPDYCMFCYQNGAFTNPDQTVDKMVQSSVDFMTANLGFSREQATQISNEVIPRLKRWT